MCYNPTISILTFSIISLASLYLFFRNYPNDRWFACLFMSAGIMQLLEFFIWIDTKCGRLNHIASLLTYILLMLQPIIVLIAAYFFGNITFNKKYLLPVIFGYVVIFGIIIAIAIKKSCGIKLCTQPAKYLDWPLQKLYSGKFLFYLSWALYFLAILILFFAKPIIPAIVIFVLLIGSLIFSIAFVKEASWKSFWCWIVNFIPIIYIAITYYKFN